MTKYPFYLFNNSIAKTIDFYKVIYFAWYKMKHC